MAAFSLNSSRTEGWGGLPQPAGLVARFCDHRLPWGDLLPKTSLEHNRQTNTVLTSRQQVRKTI